MSAADIIIYMALGSLLAIVYLGSLWLTVDRLAKSRNPFVLLGLSAIIRLALLMSAFALISGFEWKRLALCFLGFLITRLISTRFVMTDGQRKEETRAI